MLFNSFDFIAFFGIVTAVYLIIPQGLKNFWLLVASCYFYMAFVPQYILILFALILIDFFLALAMQKEKKKQKRKLFLLISIFCNVGILFFFKYFNFFSSNVSSFAQFFHFNYPSPLLQIILPIGLSFHTFQSLSYTIEVYKRKQKAEKNLLIYALFVMFYPQLVAGPIERPQHMLPQFHTKHAIDANNITEGLRRILIGLFKKMIIADYLAILVNRVYGNPHDYIGLPLVIATMGFAFQIYCDFSGYSDIAIGCARVMGFTLIENFNLPYLATSIADFWRRWHISLYSWFRDYIYIPLGGNRKGKGRQNFNVMVTFAISGLWHGASWLFIFWGALHGFYMVMHNTLQKFEISFANEILEWGRRQIAIITTFILVCIAWVFFRATSLSDALYILRNSPKGLGTFLHNVFIFNISAMRNYILRQGYGLGPNRNELLVIMFSFLVLFVTERFSQNNSLRGAPRIVRWSIYILALLSIINFGIVQRIPFIYFQF